MVTAADMECARAGGAQMSPRDRWLVAGVPPGALCLEIAPLASAVLHQAAWNVRYADHLTTQQLREKYAPHASVSVDLIPEMDYVISQAGLLEAVRGARFGFVCASHVIEHVPDPLGWLREIHALCEDGGLVALAIPDKTQCFDALRTSTIASDWIGAWLEQARRPSARSLVDAYLNSCSRFGIQTWVEVPERQELIHVRPPADALKVASAAALSDEYHDVHCWVFEPDDFLGILVTLCVLDLFPFEVVDFRGTEGNEFLIRLRRSDSGSWETRLASIPLPRTGRFAGLPAGFDMRAYLQLNPDIAAARVDPIDHWYEYGSSEGRQYSYTRG